jgi:1-deoxy-D-xylulose-5-phosphate synthase
VGADGPTHHGAFDHSFLRCIPNLTVMAPSDENECRQMLYTGFTLPGPSAVRYPRGAGPGVEVQKEMKALAVGRGEIRREGKRVAILAFGSMLGAALKAGDELNATVANMRFVKPVDRELAYRLAVSHDLVVTIEESAAAGGAGSAVAEALAADGLAVPMLHLGLPDAFVEHGDAQQLLADCGLDAAGIVRAVRKRLDSAGRRSGRAA